VTPPGAAIRRADQRRALFHIFLRRFFENDITGGSGDLRASFFWIVGFLMAPGFLIPILMSNQWDVVGRFKGPEALREQVLSSKLLYLYFGMVVSGLLASLTWNTLLLDRLDALILGTTPVRRSTTVSAKVAALGAYLVMLALAMHGLSAIAFGLVLSAGQSPLATIPGALAHLAASATSSILLFLTVVSVQGVMLAVFGPRIFTRISAGLQVCLVAAVLVSLMFVPYVVLGADNTLAGRGPANHPWLLWMPPFWYLGTYEWVLGTDRAVLTTLHMRGMIALALGASVAVGSYALAYARLARNIVESGDAAGRPTWASGAAERVTRAISTSGPARAAAQMIFTSLFRVNRLRFVLSVSLGIAIGWSLPAVVYWKTYTMTSLPPVEALALSLANVAFIVAGLRIAVAIPSDVKSAWIVPVTHPRAVHVRSGTWRALFLIGVVPISVCSLFVYAALWEPAAAIAHALTILGSGAVLIEVLLWNHDGMPHAEPWRPDRAAMGKRWPLYAIGFVVFTSGLASLEWYAFRRPALFVVLAMLLLVAGAIARRSHTERWLVTPRGDEDPGAVVQLHLQ